MQSYFTHRKGILSCFMMLFLFCAQTAFSQEIENHQTEEGITYGLWNTQVKKPAPVLIILSATIEQSLGDPYFRQCGNQLAKEGFIAVSIDLPSHGKFHEEGEPGGLAGWRKTCERKEDFVKEAVGRLSKIIDYLIKDKIADPERIAACGTSRGGFLALHLAAVDSRVNTVAAYAPVTELIALREFKGLEDNPFVRKLSLLNRADQFKGKKVWLMIGDRDERVGTDHSINLIRKITQLSLAQGGKSFAELHVMPEPKGHTTPKGAPEDSANWILNQFNNGK